MPKDGENNAGEPAATNQEVAVAQDTGGGGDVVPEDGATPQTERQPTKLESFFAMSKSLILRALIIYFISSFFRKPAATPPVKDKDGKTLAPVGPGISAWNWFENGELFDLHVYLSESFDHVDFANSKSLIWLQEDLKYGDYSSGPDSDGVFKHSVNIKTTPKLMKNGSIFLHTYVLKSGKSPDPHNDNYAKQYYGYNRKQLNKYKKIRVNRNYNLLNPNKEEIIDPALLKDTIISHWHPNLTINLVTDQTNWVKGSVPAPLEEFVHFVDNGKSYLPIVFLNDYWNLMREYQPINETTPELELHLTYQPLSMFKWQLYAAQAMKQKFAGNIFGELMSGGSEETDEDKDSLKETLLETNIYLLGVTIAISILHSVFEMLAFKNDIQFWNNRKSLEGLSVRSVFFAVFQSLVVLLYVLDNETNFMIRISCFVGLGIEVWKIHKVVDVKYDTTNKILGVIPKISFKDKGSYVESATKQYDNLAFKYLGWACFPLFFGYLIYSLVYNEHKGWYSFVLNMLYGYLLTFGFIMMTPQLFINYKLKSVAHLPWRMMTYKFLNTFIDDIFAFVIKMPTMYRLGCFRDDIVFFIFLYQRWVYKVDHKRVNEFGFSGEMETDAKTKANGAQPAAIEEKPTVDKKED